MQERRLEGVMDGSCAQWKENESEDPVMLSAGEVSEAVPEAVPEAELGSKGDAEAFLLSSKRQLHVEEPLGVENGRGIWLQYKTGIWAIIAQISSLEMNSHSIIFCVIGYLS